MTKKSALKTTTKPQPGRPPKPMPEPIPDTPKNVARAIMHGPPKKEWDHLKKPGS